MPSLLLLPPSSLANTQPAMVEALTNNSRGITSHLDVYATLRSGSYFLSLLMRLDYRIVPI